MLGQKNFRSEILTQKKFGSEKRLGITMPPPQKKNIKSKGPSAEKFT